MAPASSHTRQHAHTNAHTHARTRTQGMEEALAINDCSGMRAINIAVGLVPTTSTTTTTTTATTTTATTATTTTTVPTCWGTPDPGSCTLYDTQACTSGGSRARREGDPLSVASFVTGTDSSGDRYAGAPAMPTPLTTATATKASTMPSLTATQVRTLCPALCNTCPETTAMLPTRRTTATTTTTTEAVMAQSINYKTQTSCELVANETDRASYAGSAVEASNSYIVTSLPFFKMAPGIVI